MNFNEKIAGTAQGKFKALLHSYHACSDSLEWLNDRTVEETVRDCDRGDWLLWLAKKIDLPLNVLTLAKARCAKTVLHLMKDERSVAAINIAERFGLDQCTIDELRSAYAAASYAASAAYRAAASSAAASYAASAAYRAADASDRDDRVNRTASYAASVADAAYAAAAAAAYAASAADGGGTAASSASSASAAAYAAYRAAASSAAASYAAYADRNKNRMDTANICREILGSLIIERVNQLITK